MNCEGYRDKLIASLAGGESALGGELAAHLRLCAKCKKFYESQVHLFGAIDSGVRAMVNETVPVSLLPSVRARVTEVVLPLRTWRAGFGFVTVAVAAVLVIGAGLWNRGPASTSKALDRSPAVVHGPGGTTGLTPVRPQAIAAVPKRNAREAKTVKVPPKALKAPEVILLAEEREAFVRFVARIPADPQKAVALTRPAPPQQDLPVEIALLQIEKLKVKLLEPTAEE